MQRVFAAVKFGPWRTIRNSCVALSAESKKSEKLRVARFHFLVCVETEAGEAGRDYTLL